MKIPNFKSDVGATQFRDTIGTLISPRVGEILLKEVMPLVDGGARSILDAACGPGTVALQLANRQPLVQVTGIDVSPAMIAKAIERATVEKITNADFLQMDAGTLSFDYKKQFDLVTCNLAFPFFARPLDTLRGLRELLADSGSAIFSVPGLSTWKEFFAVAEGVMGQMVGMAKPFLLKFDQAELLPSTMLEAGFADIHTSVYQVPFSFASGRDVLDFFQQLFSLLSSAPMEMRELVAEAIDERYPDGFTMHYEAIIVQGKR